MDVSVVVADKFCCRDSLGRLVKMASNSADSYKGVGKSSMKSFQEKMNKLKHQLKETEDRVNKCKEETLAARWREHDAKLKMRAMSESINETEEKIRKIEIRISEQNDRRKEIAEKSRENFRVKEVLEGSDINIEQMMRELHDAQQHTMEVKKMNKGLLKVAAILEPKIESAERRAQKASDRAFLINQKLTVHRYLAERRPEGLAEPDQEIKAPLSEQEAKIMSLREKIKSAILRRREAERRRCLLQRKMDVLEQALANYKRRNLEFQVSKRELLSSNFY